MTRQRRLAALLLMLLMVLSSVAYAAPGDTREKTAALYGEYRLVNDSEDKVWSRADWESSKRKGALAESYVHYFSRQGITCTTTVGYTKIGGENVAVQHFSFDTPISVSQFKEYFPEIYALIADAKAKAFIVNSGELNGRFLEEKNPFSFGVIVEKDISSKDTGNYTLMSFNIRDNGRLIKDARFIDNKATIVEFVMEKVSVRDVREKLHMDGIWKPVANYFLK